MTPALFSEEAACLVKKYLSQPLFKRLEHLKTDSGFTLEKAIRSGIRNPDSAIGIYAGDAQSYELFSAIFNPVISEYHGFSGDRHHFSDLSPLDLPLLDPEKKYVRSTRIRVARNLNHFDFPCHIGLPRRRDLEKKIITGLDCLENDLKGRYLSLRQINTPELKAAGARPPVFEKGDRFQDAAGINSDFPEGRGVFYSHDGQFMVWVNEEDHLRIISLEPTSDLSSTYHRLCRALQTLGRHLEFARHDRLGYLTSCPTNLGTAMRAGVHIRLEKLNQKKAILDRLAKEYRLQLRGTRGEKTEVEDAVFDISNAQRLGISEKGIVQNLHKGILAIIHAEKNL